MCEGGGGALVGGDAALLPAVAMTGTGSTHSDVTRVLLFLLPLPGLQLPRGMQKP